MIQDGERSRFAVADVYSDDTIELERAGMGDVVNLNKLRKRTALDRADKKADINRLRFGRTKAERARDKQQAERATNTLDQHRITPETTS